jgi:signal transduction histidine kinase/CheY-like chemotaxis protein
MPLLFQKRLLGKFMVYFDQPRTLYPEEHRLAETIGRHVAFGLARVDAENKAAAALARERTARSEADAARSEAERASQTKDEFLAMLAHELRNPLGVIVHAVKVLDQVADLPADAVRAASMIDRQSSHLARLLDDLLDVARITSGRIELRSEPLDLRAVIGLAVDAQRVGVRAKEQQLTVSLPPAEVMVTGDPVRLQQVIGNLVHNASKYSAKGGSIRIEARQEGDAAVLRVSDDGEGIATDRLESIFALFVQGNPTLARTEGGLGIGLTLVKRVVELHRGQVIARSAGAGQGAAFEVRLPSTGAVPLSLPPAQTPGQTPARRILVVEDHDDGREALVTLLRLQGHEVSEAAGGRPALDLAKAQEPEVVLLDIGLPDLDGYEVARSLRQSLGPDVRLVALTGYGQPMDRERAMRAGFDAHLLKPVDFEKINEILAAPARGRLGLTRR